MRIIIVPICVTDRSEFSRRICCKNVAKIRSPISIVKLDVIYKPTLYLTHSNMQLTAYHYTAYPPTYPPNLAKNSLYMWLLVFIISNVLYSLFGKCPSCILETQLFRNSFKTLFYTNFFLLLCRYFTSDLPRGNLAPTPYRHSRNHHPHWTGNLGPS